MRYKMKTREDGMPVDMVRTAAMHMAKSMGLNEKAVSCITVAIHFGEPDDDTDEAAYGDEPTDADAAVKPAESKPEPKKAGLSEKD
jgi:hypothetical protein